MISMRPTPRCARCDDAHDRAPLARALSSFALGRPRAHMFFPICAVIEHLMAHGLARHLPEHRDDDAAALRRQSRLREIDQRRIRAGRRRQLRSPPTFCQATSFGPPVPNCGSRSVRGGRPHVADERHWRDWRLRRDTGRRWSRGSTPRGCRSGRARRRKRSGSRPAPRAARCRAAADAVAAIDAHARAISAGPRIGRHQQPQRRIGIAQLARHARRRRRRASVRASPSIDRA